MPSTLALHLDPLGRGRRSIQRQRVSLVRRGRQGVSGGPEWILVFVHVGLGVLVEGLEVARAEGAEAAGVDAGCRVEVGGFRVQLKGDGCGGLVPTHMALCNLLEEQE